MVFKLAFAAASLLLLSTPALSQRTQQQKGGASALLYCCQDAKNNRSCGDSLPPACFGKPYTIRGPGGQLVKQVDAPLTPEQLKAKQELAEKKKAEEEAKFEQRRRDSALLSTYSSETEIDKARERAEAEIQTAIAQAEKKLSELEKQREKLVAGPENKGMSADTKTRVSSVDLSIRLQKELIESKKKDLEASNAKFGEDKQRFLEIKQRRAAH